MTAESERALGEAWRRVRDGDRRGAAQAALELAEREADDAEVRGGCAAVLWAAGERAAALREARAALSLDADEANARTVLARADLAARRLSQAAVHLARAYARRPSVQRAALWARTLREAGDLEGAATVLARERARDDRSTRALRREEALLAEARGDRERALVLWQELTADPAEAAYARGRLLALRTEGMAAGEAARELRAAARVRSASDPEAGRALVLAAADRLRQGGDLAAAVDAYRAYLAEHPGDTYALRQLAFALRRLGRSGEARPLLEALIAREPADAYLRNALVADYAASGEREAGAEFFRALVAEHPEAKGLYAAIARLRASGGAPAGAGRRDAAARRLRSGARRPAGRGEADADTDGGDAAPRTDAGVRGDGGGDGATGGGRR